MFAFHAFVFLPATVIDLLFVVNVRAAIHRALTKDIGKTLPYSDTTPPLTIRLCMMGSHVPAQPCARRKCRICVLSAGPTTVTLMALKALALVCMCRQRMPCPGLMPMLRARLARIC